MGGKKHKSLALLVVHSLEDTGTRERNSRNVPTRQTEQERRAEELQGDGWEEAERGIQFAPEHPRRRRPPENSPKCKAAA